MNFKRSLSAFVRLIVLLLSLGAVLLPAALPAQHEKDARGAVQSFFALLKAQKYEALYDYLPGEMQQRVTREQLTQNLKRLNGFIALDRMEVGRVQQRGDFAVIDTIFYGRLLRPFEINGQQLREGKVQVQQYLFKEGGQWKVATSDNQTRAFFLKRHPEFSRDFQFTPPRFFFKTGKGWQAFGGPPPRR